jgi:hypothetical protein
MIFQTLDLKFSCRFALSNRFNDATNLGHSIKTSTRHPIYASDILLFLFYSRRDSKGETLLLRV